MVKTDFTVSTSVVKKIISHYFRNIFYCWDPFFRNCCHPNFPVTTLPMYLTLIFFRFGDIFQVWHLEFKIGRWNDSMYAQKCHNSRKQPLEKKLPPQKHSILSNQFSLFWNTVYKMKTFFYLLTHSKHVFSPIKKFDLKQLVGKISFG